MLRPIIHGRLLSLTNARPPLEVLFALHSLANNSAVVFNTYDHTMLLESEMHALRTLFP